MHDHIATNSITLHVVQAGPEDGHPLVLLHGFPEFWYGWRHQIDHLAGQGYRVIVPDQRGYHLSDRPTGVEAYRIDRLAQDIIGLVDALGYTRVDLAGHDWGAAVAWWLAERFPNRVRRIAILNGVHPTTFPGGNILQWFKALYIFYFQLPWLPEKSLSVNNYSLLRWTMQFSGKPDTFNEADIARYIEAWSQPGALTAMLNWYRAMRWLAGRRRRDTPPSQR